MHARPTRDRPSRPPEQTRERRLRLDALLNQIADGRFDDELKRIEEAIQERQKERQDAVLGLVQEVFGANYSVTAPKDSVPDRLPEVFRSSEPTPDASETPSTARDDEGLGPNFESRSPIIGPYVPPAQQFEEPSTGPKDG